MNLTEDFITTGKERVRRIRSFLEELELQMALGKADARDAFEKERKNLRGFLNTYKAHVNQQENLAGEKRKALTDQFLNLEARVSQEFPTTKRKFDQYKKENLQAIYEVEFSLKETYGEVGYEIREKLNEFKDKLDAYRIQLALSDVKPGESLETRKAELLETVNDIRLKLEKQESAESKMEHFVDDISDSFDKMKKAFSDLFSD